MPRDLPIGNGSLLANFDGSYCHRDLYFPHVGRDNNTVGHPCRVGLWIGGHFRWLHDAGWQRRMDYEPDSLVTDVELQSWDLGVLLRCHDAVNHEHTLLLRSFEITNQRDVEREARLLFCQDFHIGETADGDTAYYEPVDDFVIHYKGPRYFLVNGRSEDGQGIFQYSTGTKEYGNLEGTWRDVEDGELELGPVGEQERRPGARAGPDDVAGLQGERGGRGEGLGAAADVDWTLDAHEAAARGPGPRGARRRGGPRGGRGRGPALRGATLAVPGPSGALPLARVVGCSPHTHPPAPPPRLATTLKLASDPSGSGSLLPQAWSHRQGGPNRRLSTTRAARFF